MNNKSRRAMLLGGITAASVAVAAPAQAKRRHYHNGGRPSTGSAPATKPCPPPSKPVAVWLNPTDRTDVHRASLYVLTEGNCFVSCDLTLDQPHDECEAYVGTATVRWPTW